MDGNLNNGNKMGKEFQTNRALAASLASNWVKKDPPEESDAYVFYAFDRSLHSVTDRVENDAMYKARLTSLQDIFARLSSDLTKIHAQAVSNNPDHALINSLLNSAANTIKELKDDYSVFRRNYADETKNVEAFADMDKLLSKTKFTAGKNILDLANGNPNPVIQQAPPIQQVPPVVQNVQQIPPMQQVPPVVNNNQINIQPVIQPVIPPQGNINNQNVINNQNAINGQPIIPPQGNNNQPNPVNQQANVNQPNPANRQLNLDDVKNDPNNAAVRLHEQIASLKNDMNSEAEQGKLTYEQLVQRQAEIHLLERIYKFNPNLWLTNAPKAIQTLNDEVIPRTYKQKRQNDIATFEARIRNVYESLNLKKDRPVPDDLKKYYEDIHKNPLHAQNAVAIKNSVLDTNPDAIDLYNDDPVGGFSEKLLDAIAADLKFDKTISHSADRLKVINYFSTEEAQKLGQEHVQMLQEINEYLARTHFVAQRQGTITSQFQIYLMGRPENAYTYEESRKIVPGHPNFENEIRAFHDFLKENVTEGPVLRDENDKPIGFGPMDPVKAHAGAHAWAAVFHKAADKLNDITFPDIDYTNLDEIKDRLNDFNDLGSLAMDFGQNLDPFLRDTKAEYLDDVPLGRAALKDRSKTPSSLVSFTSSLKPGFNFAANSNNLNAGYANTTDKYLRKVAGGRIVFGINANLQYRNKRLGDLIEKTDTIKDLVENQVAIMFAANLSADKNVTKKMALDYLKGNGEEYKQYVLNNWSNQVNTVRIDSFNEMQLEHTHNAQSIIKTASALPGFKEKCRQVFAPGRTGEEIFADLNKEENRIISEKGASIVHSVLEAGFQQEYLALVEGLDNPADTIKIDGKTMEELWGEKYAFLQDPAQKMIAYRAELINEAIHGHSHITFDCYAISKDFKIVQNGTETIVDSAKTLEEKRKFLRSVQTIHRHMEYLSRTIRGYQSRPENKALYDELKAKTKKCLDRSALDNNTTCNYPLLKADLQDLENLTSQFFTAEETYYRNNNRVQEADAAQNIRNRTLGTLTENGNAMDLYGRSLRIAPSPEFGTPDKPAATYSFGAIKSRLDESSKIRFGKELDLEHPVVSYEGEMDWLNHLTDDEIGFYLPQDKYNLLDQKLDFHIGSSYMSDRIESGRQIISLPGFSNELATNDPTRIHSLFVMWAMAKKGLTLEEAVSLSERPVTNNLGQVVNQATIQRNDEYRSEFLAFAIAHPMTKPQNATAESERERMKGWFEVFKDARTRLEGYKFPDIDYEDVNQVRPHLKPLMEIRALSVDAVQEWDKFQKKFDSYPEIAKTAGTEKELDSNRQFYFNLQNTGLSLMGGYAIAGDGRLQTDKICQVINQRYETGKMMMNYRGKTLKEYMDAKKATLIGEDVYLENLETLRTDVGYGPDVKMTLGYALGANGNVYDDVMDRMRAEANRRWKVDLTANQKRHFAAFRADCLKNPEVRNLILASGDDAQSMKNLFAQGLTDKTAGGTVGEYVLRTVNNTLTQDYQGGILTVLGEKKSHLFLIDGHSPEELWGDKYNDLTEDEKEFMLRLETVKCIAKGDKTVKMRQYDLKSDGKEVRLVETEPETVFLPKEQLQQIFDGASYYMGEKESLLSELKIIRAHLITTQDDDKKDHNFFNTSVTGSTSYQTMCKTLQNTIELLEKDGTSDGENISPDSIRRNLTALQQASDEYYKDHYGYFFRPITNKGSIRLNMSEKMKSGLLDRFDNMRQKIDVGLVGYDRSMKEVSSYLAKVQANRMAPSAGLDVKGDDYYFNSVIKRELHVKLRGLKESASVQNMANDPKPLAQAKTYLLGLFESYDAAPADGVGAKKQNPNMLRLIELFDQKAYFLSRDPVFLRMMTVNPEDCINRWQDIEKQELELQKEYTREWNKFTDGYPDAAHYILGIKTADVNNGVTLQSKMNENAADPEGEDLINAFYDQAGKVIVIQLLAESNNDQAEYYRKEIAADPNRYQELLRSATEYLKSQNAISADTISSFATKINEDKYKTSFFKYLENREKEAQRQKESEISGTRVHNYNQIMFLVRDYRNKKVTPLQHSQANNVLHLTDIRNVMEKHENASQYLNSPITAMNAQGVEVTIQPDVAVYGQCNMGRERLASLHGPMILYAMSEKNLSLDEAINLVLTGKVLNENGNLANEEEFKRAQQLRYDFYNFCKDHPVDKADLSQEKLTENFKAWAKIYRDGSAKFMQERLTNINYRDEKQINDNLGKIGMVYRVIIDADQELTRIFNFKNNGVSGLNVAKDECGGEKAFYEIKNNWWNLSSKMSYFEHGYANAEQLRVNVVTAQNQNMEHFRNKILDMAVLRYMAKQEMNSNAGKTFDEIAHQNPVQLLIQKDVVNAMKHVASDIFTDEGVYREGVSPEDAINYLLGVDTETFEKAVNKLLVKVVEDSKQSRYESQSSKAVTFRNSFTLDDEGMNKLLATGDDAASMRNFLTTKINPQDENSPTGDAWLAGKVDNSLDGLFNQEASEICSVVKINPSDLIRIDGKSPEELWGVKYADVKDYELKERLYRLEIAKEIAKGEHDITLRLFKLGDNELEETKPMLFVPKRETLKSLADGLHVYEAGKNELQFELNRIKAQLTATQADPSANFVDGVNPEGSDSYQAMTRGLKNLLICFERDNNGEAQITVQNFLDSFDYTLAAAEDYARKHTGKKENNAKVRVDVSKKLMEVIPRMKESYLRMRKGFESDLAAAGSENLKDGRYFRIRQSIANLQNHFNIPSENELTYQKRFIVQDVKCRLDIFKQSPLPEDAELRENMRMAREYLDYYYRTKADDGLITEDELRKFDDTYKAGIDALKDDSTFLNLMKKHGVQKVATFWSEAETISAQIKQEAVNSVNEIKESYDTYARYISSDPTNKNDRSVNELNKAAAVLIKQAGAKYNVDDDNVLNDNDALDKMYLRLASVVVTEIMSRDTAVGRSLRSAVAVEGGAGTARGKKERDTIVENFAKILKAYQVLMPKNVDRAVSQLESGRLIDDLEAEYEFNRVWNEQQKNQNLIQNEPKEDLGKSFIEFIDIQKNEDGNLIQNEIGENDINLAFGQDRNNEILIDDDSLDDGQDEIKLDNIRNELEPKPAKNQGNPDYNEMYDRCLDQEKFRDYNDPNNIMNDNEGGDPYGISKEQFTTYMKGAANALNQLNSIDREEKYQNGEYPEEKAQLKGKYFIHAVTARALFTGEIKIRPHENIAKLEERVIMGHAFNSVKPDAKAVRMEAMKRVLENTSGQMLVTYAKDGTFNDIMDREDSIVRQNMAKNAVNKGQPKVEPKGNQMGGGKGHAPG